MVIIGINQIKYTNIIEYNKERLKTSKMQETNRRDKNKDTKYYKWNVTTDETTRPATIIIPNTPLKLNFRELNKDYNRHIILNYYYEYLMKRPRFDFKTLMKMIDV